MSYLISAQKVRAAMDAAGEELSNQKAIECKCLYRQWADLIGSEAKPGRRFLYGQDLFKVRADAGTHNFSREWRPGPNTASLYEAINEAHAGTADDPIPWVQPMNLSIGLYYSEGGKTYYCTRDSGQPLAFKLAELVGLYIEEVNS